MAVRLVILINHLLYADDVDISSVIRAGFDM